METPSHGIDKYLASVGLTIEQYENILNTPTIMYEVLEGQQTIPDSLRLAIQATDGTFSEWRNAVANTIEAVSDDLTVEGLVSVLRTQAQTTLSASTANNNFRHVMLGIAEAVFGTESPVYKALVVKINSDSDEYPE